MKHLLYALLTTVSILFISYGSSPSTNIPQEPNVPQPQPQPQPEVTQKVVVGYLTLDDWESENLFPTVEWKYLTHIGTSFARVKTDGTLNINLVRKRIKSTRETAHKHNVKILISLAKNNPGEFAAAINDPGAGKGLMQQIITFIKEYKLDGFDINYEEYDNQDRDLLSLLVFARDLCLAEEKNMLMTCVVDNRWFNYGIEWEQYFDYINLMSYDWGASTDKPVQHASYGDFVKDLKYWNGRCRASKDRIVGGLPFYGHSQEESL